MVDSSVSNANQVCLPLLNDIRAALPLRSDSAGVAGCSVDIESARKIVRVRKKDQGLLGFGRQERLLFYKVWPFKAVFSSGWFARVGGFLTRCLHLLAYVLMLYSDDLLLRQNKNVLPVGATFVLALFAAFNVPISWPKLQVGPQITWIGWELNFAAGGFRLPQTSVPRP